MISVGIGVNMTMSAAPCMTTVIFPFHLRFLQWFILTCVSSTRLYKVWLSKKSLTARGELLSVDGPDCLETYVSKTILSGILEGPLTLSETGKGNDSARKVPQCHKSVQYQWNPCIAKNKSICLDIKIPVSKNIAMLYFALVHLLKCSTLTRTNIHLL